MSKAHFLKEGETEYLKRLRRYAQVDWAEVKPTKIRKGISTEEVLKIEGQAISHRLASEDHLITLDRLGELFSSEELASLLDKLSTEIRGKA